MEIKILGVGCPKCMRLEQLAREAADELGLEPTFTHVKDIDEIASCGILATPALVINGRVATSGRIPRKDEVIGWLSNGGANAAPNPWRTYHRSA